MFPSSKGNLTPVGILSFFLWRKIIFSFYAGKVELISLGSISGWTHSLQLSCTLFLMGASSLPRSHVPFLSGCFPTQRGSPWSRACLWSLVVRPDLFWGLCLAQFTLPLSCVFPLWLMRTICVISSMCVLFCFVSRCYQNSLVKSEGWYILKALWGQVVWDLLQA